MMMKNQNHGRLENGGLRILESQKYPHLVGKFLDLGISDNPDDEEISMAVAPIAISIGNLSVEWQDRATR